MDELTRYNGNLARPLPPRREPERVRVPDDDDRDVIVIHYGWKQAVGLTLLAVGIGGVVMTLLALFLADILRAAAGG